MSLNPSRRDDMKARVLICEDEPIVALDVQLLVESFGYSVMGPFATVKEGLEALNGGMPDAAVLDVRLRDGEVFPLAAELAKRGVGIVFHSGHTYQHELSQRFPGAGFCQKPVSTALLENELRRVADEQHVRVG